MVFKKGNKICVGRVISEETRQKISDANKGHIAWNEGKHHSKETILKIKEARKNQVFSLETREKMRVSRLGRKHTEESKQKMKDARKKQIFSIETRYKMSKTAQKKVGDKNNFFGKKHTAESKKQMSESLKGITPWNKGIPRTIEEKNKISESKIGKYVGANSPTWKGGVSFEPYCHKFTLSLKEKVRNEYGRKCFLCGKTEKANGRKLDVHHFLYDKMEGCNGNGFKLVPLCRSCHAKTNYNREYFQNMFIEKLITTNCA